jgi:hypothetical protein
LASCFLKLQGSQWVGVRDAAGTGNGALPFNSHELEVQVLAMVPLVCQKDSHDEGDTPSRMQIKVKESLDFSKAGLPNHMFIFNTLDTGKSFQWK